MSLFFPLSVRMYDKGKLQYKSLDALFYELFKGCELPKKETRKSLLSEKGAETYGNYYYHKIKC